MNTHHNDNSSENKRNQSLYHQAGHSSQPEQIESTVHTSKQYTSKPRKAEHDILQAEHDLLQKERHEQHPAQWMNPILLRRAEQVMLPVTIDNNHDQKQASENDLWNNPVHTRQQHTAVDQLLASLLQEIEQLGYTFTTDLIEQCRQLSVQSLTELYQQIVPVLREQVGDHVQYQPMYPQFPDQVMEASAAELFINALLHYRFGIRPQYDTVMRPPAEPKTHLQPISLATADTCIGMLRNLAAANGSLSAQDKDDLTMGLWMVEQVEWLLPEQIPYKENAAFIASVLLEAGRADGQRLSVYFRTATDVLRLAAGLSGLATDLAWAKKLPQLRNHMANVYNLNQGMHIPASTEQADNPRNAYHFRKFRRAERRLLLGLLERIAHPLENMVLYREQWKRLGELLHPGEMRTRYPRAWEAFTALRRQRSIPTMRTEIEQGMIERDPAVIAKLGTRPGELARRLDALLRSQPKHTTLIMEQFQLHIEELAVPLLLQMMAHFRHRQQQRRYRVFFPKGNTGKAVAIPNRLPRLKKSITKDIVNMIQQELKRRFAERPALGRVYIDPQLKGIPVPWSQRSASRALRTVPRGSRIAMPAGDIVRLFCWWKNMDDEHHSRVDIDLSAVLLDGNWQQIETLAFYNLKGPYGVHSGDIVDAPEGASEFIDLYISQIKRHTYARYVLMQIACYTGQAIAELPECFAGFMMRGDQRAGEIYDPATVQAKFDLTVEAQQAVPFVLDLQTREMIWMDAIVRNRSLRITAADNMTSLQMLGHAFTDLRRPMLAELFALHAQARGQLVDRIEEADTVFAMEQGVTPYQTDVILAHYL
ncbi:TerD family protein [Paenibacillus wenxiniae]|uniref:TerD family protein n=1 Tax=Paenibacillus wenxiniae TaxID=1636843 RepID=A0ABW4RNX9_9BACL